MPEGIELPTIRTNFPLVAQRGDPIYTSRALGTRGALIAEEVANVGGYYNGAALDSPDITVSEAGGVVTLSVEKSGGGNIDVLFSTGVETWVCAPDTVVLTAGSDISPTLNYVYFLASTSTLTAAASWPSAVEFVPIATVLCQSAASIGTYGPYKVHAWTDHLSGSDSMGHLAHVNHWIRHQPATWESGVALTPTITSNGGAVDNVDIATSAGVILQLHDHAFPAFDTGGSSVVYVMNDFNTAYNRITDLNAANEDDAGNAIATNQHINLVVWGVVSEKSGDCKLFVNLPSGFHGNSAIDAKTDAEKLSNYTIPSSYRGTGFLIARLTLKYTAVASGTWSVVETLDLRAQGAIGGTGVGQVEFADNIFRIQAVADPTKQVDFDASAITTATKRTITMPDANVDLGALLVAADIAGFLVAADIAGLALKSAESRTVSDASDTLLVGDNGKVIIANRATAIAFTLPDTFDVDWQCTIIQVGAGVPTVTRSGTDTINGAATGVAPSAQWKALYLTQFAAGEWLAVL